MYLAGGGKAIPPQWEHDPAVCDENGTTVAMYLSSRKRDIPKQWEHDPTI